MVEKAQIGDIPLKRFKKQSRATNKYQTWTSSGLT